MPPKKRRIWVPFLIVGLVVVLVGGGVTGWLALRAKYGPRDEDQRPSATLLWKQATLIDERPLNSWASDGIIAVMHEDRLYAFNAETGEKAWDFQPPLRAGEKTPLSRFCGMSHDVKNGLGVISFGPYIKSTYGGTGCSTIAVVDVKTGVFKWQLDLPVVENRGTTNFTDPEIVGDLVVFSLHDIVFGVNLADGKEVWRHDQEPRSYCNLSGPAISERTTVFPVYCPIGEPEYHELLFLDTATGAVKGRTRLDADTFPAVISADPPIAAVDPSTKDEVPGSLLVFDDIGRKVTEFPQELPAGRLDVNPINSYLETRARMRFPIIVTDGMLVGATWSTSVNAYRETNKIVAVDLKTGQQRWDIALGKKIAGRPFAATANGILAINAGTHENPPQVFEIPLSGGSPRAISGLFPSEVSSPVNCNLHWGNGTVYGVRTGGGTLGAPLVFAVR
ncbi:putative pyrroloquinoline-quinone binding quinoprotein [Saccharopolyspora spinosa]|uniref:Pyrroloquinoline-quinone binding quinoprotein n=2 Tax=Saccharopolyspora spinosa TaxID=60894 RepID=A0A2N3XTS3_SACSN|nr:putative pyrroloquinoline-quinone binding quinoprotein [Saccharopolyspora spinosa]